MADQPEATTEELLQQLLEQQKAHRDEVAELRKEIAQSRQPVQHASTVTPLSQEELLAQRLDEMGQHSHYCPACGILGDYPQKCSGRDESPHYPTEMSETSEVTEGDRENHTAAPYVTGEGKVVVPS